MFSLYFDVFEFYIFGFDAEGVRAGIYLRAGSGGEHLVFVRRCGKGYLFIDECDAFRVGDGHAGLYGSTSDVLIAEAEGVFLPQTRLDNKGRWLAFLCLLRLIDGSRTRVNVQRQLGGRKLGDGVGIEGVPEV